MIQVEWALLIYSLICAAIAAVMAHRKARHVGLWGLLGLTFGIFALIVLTALDRSIRRGSQV